MVSWARCGIVLFILQIKIKQKEIIVVNKLFKVLLEKLLYNCSDLKKIFLLIRDKKGKTTNERVRDFLSLPVS